MKSCLGILLASLIAAPAWAQSPPIFNPGAPGAPSRIVSADEAVALSRTTFTPGDVRFMQHMVVHHGQAVEMVGLLREKGTDPKVKLIGERIALSQEAEIELMRNWLADRGQAQTMTDTHAGHAGMNHAAHAGHAMAASDTPIMPGMLSPAQMQTLASAKGPDFDRLFLQGMIQHHQGALDMVDDLLAQPDAAQDPMLSDFASSVVADQSAEILRMQSLLSDL